MPTDGSQRIEYFQNLDRHLVTRRRLIIGGDFNCMLDLAKDKRGGNESLGGTGAPHLNNLIAAERSEAAHNLVPRACDPWEGNEASGIIRCRKPGILAKIELRIHFNGQSDSSLKRIIPEPSFPSQGSQARGTRLGSTLILALLVPVPSRTMYSVLESRL